MSSKLIPLKRAPENVFKEVFENSVCDRADEQQLLEVDSSCAYLQWKNCFSLPVQYTLNLCKPLLESSNPLLAEYLLPRNISRRFCIIDGSVWHHYGKRLQSYFEARKVNCRYHILEGGEENKNMEAVFSVLDALCEFGLHRREPILAIGGGVILDIAGFAASLYRRGVPYLRVPTTLLGIVDASVGVKTGVDYTHTRTNEHFKNRVGAFYAPLGALLDKSFIATQDERNIINGLGEILKLALVRSKRLFCLLEDHAAELIETKFQTPGVADRVIELSVEIMLEELGPNLWEQELERCVDYGHTFSKILEMKCLGDLFHGEAVNIDGFLCVLLSEGRGWLDSKKRNRILHVMRDCCRLPIYHPLCEDVDTLWQGVLDGVEHRDGSQRIPLLREDIGQYAFVNDLTREEVAAASMKLSQFNRSFTESLVSR
jgi:3-dehydroquinate synthase